MLNSLHLASIRIATLTCKFIKPNIVTAYFVRMRSISRICTHTQRIYGTWNCISHQYVVDMIKITIDTDNILTN